MNPIYLGDIDLNEETLAHFGVKGMKWGKRKARLKGKALELRAKYKRKLKGIKKDEATWDIKTGKSRLSKDDGKNRSTTRPTGNKTDFDYYQKVGGDYGAKERPSSSNNGYSDRSINSNFKHSPSSSTYDTNKNYKRNSDGSLSYSKKLYPTKHGGKTNTSGQTTKWEPKTNDEKLARYTHNTNNNTRTTISGFGGIDGTYSTVKATKKGNKVKVKEMFSGDEFTKEYKTVHQKAAESTAKKKINRTKGYKKRK